ncbi:MAG: NUMOD3 domain-containing DNA-binding protein [Methanolobus sp.]|uniref:NUMOD3 domain-containing DNA-binding protein n=1 Tax=Methanolobus sp. TaxID=1874737 RepID=UPI00272F61EB|nr:NUMOD3 domain-containing DNA-binding protein [Methanolobus sp.]MDP2217207.1 NUMOD3 domain-containing DNA-binding protein [Methanolobus sp.]
MNKINTWVQNEQQKQHNCFCGCGGEIKIQRRYYWIGIPRFISGHNTKVANPMDNSEVREKVSEANKGEKNPMYGRKSPMYGVHRYGKKAPFYQKHHTQASKKRMSEAHKGLQSKERHPMWGKRGKDNPLFGKPLTDEHRKKISDALKGRPLTEEHRRKVSIAMSGEKHPMYGKHLTEETRKKLSECKKGEKHPLFGKCGEIAPNWHGGKSFEPYCPKFNHELKEKIRERDNRTCQLCCVKENGRKLDVHHIHYDKPNCNPDLIALCFKCNTKVNFNRDYYENLFMEKLTQRGLII